METSLLDLSFDANWRMRPSGAESYGQEAPVRTQLLQEIKTQGRGEKKRTDKRRAQNENLPFS